jgi:Ca2+-binding RTX toxin-like protein
VANVNDAPTGAPVVSGTATVGQVLTASAGTLADADGLGALAFTWQRDSVLISGATGSTYTLAQADVGRAISVRASYTDGAGKVEAVTSLPTALVANVNDTPTGRPVITGTAIQGQTLNASTSTLADLDGLGTLAFTWQRDGAAISGATGASYTLGSADVGKAVRVLVSYVDGFGFAEQVSSASVPSGTAAYPQPVRGGRLVQGTAGNDQLQGGNQADVLIGGAGNDVLTGGRDSDTFVFAVGGRQDRITDFVPTADKLFLQAITTVVGIENVTVGGETGARILYAGDVATGDWVFLSGVNATTLGPSNFLFG